MNKKSLLCLYINIIFSMILIAQIQSDSEVNPIKTELNDEIIKEDFTLEDTEYFYYELSALSSQKNMVLTIHNSIGEVLNIECILSESTSYSYSDIANEFQNKNNICLGLHFFSNKRTNVLVDLDGYKDGQKLFLKISPNKKENPIQISIFVRKTDNYKTTLETTLGEETISNSYAYVGYEFDPKKFYESGNEYLLTTSEANGLLIASKKNNELTLIDETTLLAISEQSLAAHFWNSEKIVIFVGKKQYDEEATENNIVMSLIENSDKKSKKYYYYKVNVNGGLSSFHSECPKEGTEHYLIMSYEDLDSENYYFRINNLVGIDKVYLADITEITNDISKLKFTSLKYKYDYLKITDFHLKVFKFICPEEENRIIANIYFNKRYKYVDNDYLFNGTINDYFHQFVKDGNNTFTVKYPKTINELKLEVFTLEDVKLEFEINFEGKNIKGQNNEPYFLPVTDNTVQTLTINVDANNLGTKPVEALISAYSDKERIEGEEDYLKLHNGRINDIFYQYYLLNHEFNANYNFYVNLENPNDEIISLCYYLPDLFVLYTKTHNCFLMRGNKVANFNFNNIFKYDNTGNFESNKEKYRYVIYNDDLSKYKMKLNFENDLPKSVPINNTFLDIMDNLKYVDAKLEHNKNSYFNLEMSSSKEVNHIDLYVNNLSGNQGIKLDIKCIVKIELAIDYIEKFFTEENNVCQFINKDDTNTNVYHIMFTNKKSDANEKFIMQVSSNKDLDIKIVVDLNSYVTDEFNYKENVYILEYPSVYKIFQINKTKLEEQESNINMVLYDFDENGIEIYGQKDKSFYQIEKGSFLIFKINELLSKYADYDQFLFVLGRADCENNFCDEISKFQLKYIQNLYSFKIDEFKENYHLPFSSKICSKKNPNYIIFDYGKEHTNYPIYLSKYILIGDNYNPDAKIVDNLEMGNFEAHFYNVEEDKSYNILQQNKLHRYILRVTCQNYIYTYFDFFSLTEKKEITLNKGSIHYFIIKNSTNYTFHYNSIDEIDVIWFNKQKQPSIVFEKKNKKIISSLTMITLRRNNDDNNKFYLAAPESYDIPLRIITKINVENLPKTEINNLYKLDDKFIYQIPDAALNVTLYIKPKRSRLRRLEETQKGIKVCYNVANTVLLDKNDANCVYMEDKAQIEYAKPENSPKTYLVVYPYEDNQEIEIERVFAFIPGGENSGKGGNSGDGNGEGGSKWWVVLLIILLILILVGVGVFVFLKIKKKRVSSEAIEKDVKKETPMEIVD